MNEEQTVSELWDEALSAKQLEFEFELTSPLKIDTDPPMVIQMELPF